MHEGSASVRSGDSDDGLQLCGTSDRKGVLAAPHAHRPRPPPRLAPGLICWGRGAAPYSTDEPAVKATTRMPAALLLLLLLVLLLLQPHPSAALWHVMPHHDFWSAARQGHLDEVQRHLDEGEASGVGNPHPPCNPGACTVTNLDPDEIDPKNNWTGLHWALIYQQSHVVQHLIDLGANVNSTNSHGMTPLHQAARSGDIVSAKLLIEAGADVDAMDNHGATPLIHAAQKGEEAVLEELLRNGANHNHAAHGYDRQNTKQLKTVREWAEHKDEHHILPLLDAHIARLNSQEL
eukprot:SAG22_NODE_5_length_41775_cov_111.520971_6_plen_292_part_00